MSIDLVFDVELCLRAEAKAISANILSSFVNEEDIAFLFINYYYAFFEIV